MASSPLRLSQHRTTPSNAPVINIWFDGCATSVVTPSGCPHTTRGLSTPRSHTTRRPSMPALATKLGLLSLSLLDVDVDPGLPPGR